MPRTGDKLLDQDRLSDAQQAQKEAMEMFLELARVSPWSTDDNQHIVDSKDRKIPLKPENVELSHVCKNKHASCGIKGLVKQIILKVNTQYWHNSSPSRKFSLLAHELVHIRHHHHKPLFWDSLKLHMKIYAKNLDRVESSFGIIDFEEVWNEHVSSSIHCGSVDRRSETVRERKNIMEEIKEYGYKYGNKSRIPDESKIGVNKGQGTVAAEEEEDNSIVGILDLTEEELGEKLRELGEEYKEIGMELQHLMDDMNYEPVYTFEKLLECIGRDKLFNPRCKEAKELRRLAVKLGMYKEGKAKYASGKGYDFQLDQTKYRFDKRVKEVIK